LRIKPMVESSSNGKANYPSDQILQLMPWAKSNTE
jgi:hypothetical protein